MKKIFNAEYESIPTDEILPINVFTFQAKNPDRIIPKHWHHNVELIYCLEGGLDVWIGQTLYSMQKDDLLLINSNIVHSTRSPHENKIMVLQISSSFLEKITEENYNQLYEFDLNTVKNLDYNKIHLEKIKTILIDFLGYSQCASVENGLKKMSLTYELLYNLLLNFKKEYTYRHSFKTNKYIERMNLIVGYIEQRYKYDISLAETANEFNFSPPYFSRFFKKYMGITFSEYITSLRMDVAYRLLVETDQSITEIAMNAGFANSKAFTKQFVKMYQTTPYQFRKKYK